MFRGGLTIPSRRMNSKTETLVDLHQSERATLTSEAEGNLENLTDRGNETGCPRNGITEQGNETGDGEHSKGAPSFPSWEPLNARQNEPAAELLKGTPSPTPRPAREPTAGSRSLPPGRPSVPGMVCHGVWTLPILPAETKLMPPALKGGRG